LAHTQQPSRWLAAGAIACAALVAATALGGVLIAQGLAFYLLWLAEDVPAMIAAGAALLRRRAAGVEAAAVMLSFAVLMAIAIGGMIVVMQTRGLASDLGPAIGMGIAATASAVALWRLLRSLAAGSHAAESRQAVEP